jgi:hypothetical protein
VAISTAEAPGKTTRRRAALAVAVVGVATAAVAVGRWSGFPHLRLVVPRWSSLFEAEAPQTATPVTPSPATLAPPPASVPPPPVAIAEPEVLAATPFGRKDTLRAGETRDFSLVVRGVAPAFSWTIDDAPAGTGPRWTFTPAASDVGRHRVRVTVTDGGRVASRTWVVRVRPPAPPRILAAVPTAGDVEAVRGDPVRLRIEATPGSAPERLDTRWSVDGSPAAEGGEFTFRRDVPGVSVVRAIVTGEHGGTVGRAWRISVHERPPEPTAPPAVSQPPSPATRVARERSIDDARRWLARYTAAWNARDVAALVRLGQVHTPREIEAMHEYFAAVRELDVEVDLIAIRETPDGATIRFTRRDRFRDPIGRLVLKETPPIEKHLVRTAHGLRVASPSG